MNDNNELKGRPFFDLSVRGIVQILFVKDITFSNGDGVIDYLARFWTVDDKKHTVRLKTPYTAKNKPVAKNKDEVWYIIGMLKTDFYKKDEEWIETSPYIQVYDSMFKHPDER